MGGGFSPEREFLLIGRLSKYQYSKTEKQTDTFMFGKHLLLSLEIRLF